MKTNSCSTCHGSKAKGSLFGLLLVMAGLLFLSFNFGWIDPALKPVIFSWPMIFIMIGVIGFSKNNYLFSLFSLFIGIFFLLPRIAVVYPDSFQGIDGDFTRMFWPLLLIVLGISFIFKVMFAKNGNWVKKSFHIHIDTNADSEETSETSGKFDRCEGVGGIIEKRVIFGGSESIFLDPILYGGDIEAIFGGVVIDLRKTQLPEGVTYLNIEAVFGGVELYIPADWFVESKFQTVMAGFHDQRMVLPSDKSRKLVLKGDLIFGGCNIR